MRPKADDVWERLGFEKFAWFNRLKASALNSRCERSVMANLLIAEKSTFLCPGPRTIPTPEFPNVVALPSLPTIENGSKQLLLK
jgi:hypothetical protein